MADFKGKKGHWVTTESGSHVFIESGKSFDEAISDAFGKENAKKYKKADDYDYDKPYSSLYGYMDNPDDFTDVDGTKIKKSDLDKMDIQYGKSKADPEAYDRLEGIPDVEEDENDEDQLQYAEDVISEISHQSNFSDVKAIDGATRQLMNEFELDYSDAKKIAMKAYDNLYGDEDFDNDYEEEFKEPEEKDNWRERWQNEWNQKDAESTKNQNSENNGENDWDIADEDKEIFIEQMENMNEDLDNISDVTYVEARGYDGAYKVTYKDGSTRKFGWREDDFDYTLHPIGKKKAEKSEKGAVTPGKKHSESNEYNHTVDSDSLIKAVNNNNKYASHLLDVAEGDFEENLNNGSLDKQNTIKHWKDIADKLDESKVSDNELKNRIKKFKETVNSYSTAGDNQKQNDWHEKGYMLGRDNGLSDEDSDELATLIYDFMKKKKDQK